MGLGKILGTAVGTVGGAFLGGPAGAMMGASLGGSLGGMLDGQESVNANPAAYASQVDPAIEARIKRNILTGQDQNALKFTENQMGSQVAGQQAQIASARGVNAGLAQRLGSQALAQGLADSSMKGNQLASSNVNQQLQAYLTQKSADRQSAIGLDQSRMAAESDRINRENNQWSGLMNGLGQAGMTMYGMPTQTPAPTGSTGGTGYLGVNTNLSGNPAPVQNPYSLGVDYSFK